MTNASWIRYPLGEILGVLSEAIPPWKEIEKRDEGSVNSNLMFQMHGKGSKSEQGLVSSADSG